MHCSGSILGTMKLIRIKRERGKQTPSGNCKLGDFYCKTSLQNLTARDHFGNYKHHNSTLEDVIMCVALRTRKIDVLNVCDPRLVFEELPSLAHNVRIQVFGVKGNWTQFYALLSRSNIKLKES